jgi:segregation and condensation protein A
MSFLHETKKQALFLKTDFGGGKLDTPVFHLKQVVRTKEPELQDFHGPLDLILYLLGKHKVELSTLSLTMIVAQYLDYLEERDTLDLSIASEFVAMAAHLVYLKTRLLLSAAEEEVQAEVEELASSLEIHRQSEWYEAVKQTSEELARRYESGANRMTRRKEPIAQEPPQHEADALLQAMHCLFKRQQGQKPPSIALFQALAGRRPYPVEEKAQEVLRFLSKKQEETFWALLRRSRDRSELIATFLAVLELCRKREVHLVGQSGKTATLRLVEKICP